ncbi:transporter substrate-binding domain-containing protein [Bdellovibrio sp. SKB1291214]|uniref:substrate-binding periplasmic protein n=1 Tax=Bdellovibrio sp. SKB1291214 TaxID=1732569 RepID=UPI00224063E3|nr:transporter substrate-binding domain-containing protein [Bdellovibrio sp. SKB1291214]UYL09821.1 transporter substrate-binding domain-containing protein [Bdellovibrio sp. SKB1291214]
MGDHKMLRLYIFLLFLVLPTLSIAESFNKIKIYAFENPPLVVKTGEGFAGLAGYYGKAVAASLEESGQANDFELVWVPYKRGLMGVDKDVHGLFFAVDRTSDRETKFNWVMNFGEVECWLYATDPNVQINSLSDLRKYRIGVQGGSARESEIRRYMGWSPKVEAIADDNANLRKLHAGRIDIWATRPMVMVEAQKAMLLTDKSPRPLRPLKLLFKQNLWMIGNIHMPVQSKEIVKSVFGWEGKEPVKSPALSARDILKSVVSN